MERRSPIVMAIPVTVFAAFDMFEVTTVDVRSGSAVDEAFHYNFGFIIDRNGHQVRVRCLDFNVGFQIAVVYICLYNWCFRHMADLNILRTSD